jgi:hypothetical protein
MNKQLSIVSMFLGAIVGIIILTASNLQQGNGKNDKGQQQGQGKGNQKANDPKGKPDKTVTVNQGQGNGNQGQGQGNGNANANQAKDKNDNGKGNGNANNNNGNNGKGNDIIRLDDNNGKGNGNGNGNNKIARIKNLGGDNWYNWTKENFRDRSQYRNKGKVTICHKFRSNEEPVTISVSENAMKAHMGHGDVVGNCPAVTNSIFSDIFQRRRAAYYNDLYYGQDQYNYSNSILDYALMRLADSRSQLDYMRVNNYPAADIDRRQNAVLGLEQNVSLLETVLGVAGQLLVNRLN